MSVNFIIPHNSQTIPTTTVFSAPFGVSIPGKYNFADASQKQPVVQLQAGSVFLIERLSVGGNISDADYLAAINPANVPLLTIQKQLTYNERINVRPIPIVQFYDGLETAFWVIANKGGDYLSLSLTGLLNQTADLVGVASVSIAISFVVWQIDERYFNTYIRDSIEPSFSAQIRSNQ